MQRLARVTIQTENKEILHLLSSYNEIERILLRHLPPSTASIFARPELSADNKIIEWYSDLQGQPQLLGNSQADQQKLKEIQPLLEQRINDIRELNQSLSRQNLISPAQSQLLQQLVDGASHNTKQIYLVNNEPVITGWGIGEKPAPVIPPVAVPVATKKPKWCWWLLPLLLLLLAALWWFFVRQPEVVVPEPLPVIEQPKVEQPKVEEPTPEPKVEEPKVEEPKVEEVKEEPKVEEPPQKVCHLKITPAEAPQMVIIFNNAAAMRYTIKEPIAKIQAFDKRRFYEPVPESEIQYMYRKPNRSTASKTAVNRILASIDPSIDIGLVELKSCLTASAKSSAATSHGIFSANKRETLKQKINAMHIREIKAPGTPIYEGLQKALKMVDGKEKEAFILLITEGNGDCTDRDPCRLIKQELKRRPKLKINIVSINSPWDATDCLASLTGGQIFKSQVNNETQLTDLINSAVKSMQQEEICE